jgi:hypothetical protein
MKKKQPEPVAMFTNETIVIPETYEDFARRHTMEMCANPPVPRRNDGFSGC